MTPHDQDTTKFGDTVALLIVDGDPPTVDCQRAVEALKATPGIKDVWLTPYYQTYMGSKDYVDRLQGIRDMCSIAAIEMGIGCCTIALDKKMAFPSKIKEECMRLFPYFEFKRATIGDQWWSEADVTVKFASSGKLNPVQDKIKSDAQVVVVNCLECPDVRGLVASGRDASRFLQPPVWNYLQKRKLYR